MTRGNAWLGPRAEKPGAHLRMFCLPYAGGASGVYQTWQKRLPASVDVCPVELPGRLTRMREEPIDEMPVLLSALLDALGPELDRPFALFGCSMGALVAFEFARRLRAEGRPPPAMLIVAAREAPQVSMPSQRWLAMSDAEFLESLQRDYRPIPEPLLADVEMRSLIVRMLRADFTLLARYQFRPEPPLACPILAIGGTRDARVGAAGLQAWREHTQLECWTQWIEGDHFFIETQRDAVLAMLQEKLARLAPVQRH